MHWLLINWRLSRRTSYGLSIQSHRPMDWGFRVTNQPSRFLSTTRGSGYPDHQLREQRLDLFSIQHLENLAGSQGTGNAGPRAR
jgi:hypothetical protein